jgi:hypothetical protein
MAKIYSLFFVLCIAFSVARAQTDSLSKADKAMLDSMMANDEFLKLMNEGQKNTVDISIGVGNGSFSAHNNAANATGVVNQLIFTPSIVYRTKEGFSIGATGFITDDNAGKLNLYQTGLSASYDYTGKEILTGLSYTRYLSDKNKYNTKALYQNDIYGYVKRAKGIIQPGLALGYANGNYKEVSYTSFVLKRLLRPDTLISGFDSTDNKVSYFSASVSAEHNFSFYKLFSKNDGLDFTPALILNCGSDKNTQTHTNRIFDRIRKLNTVKKVESNNKFQVQSVAASFDLTYGVGKFFLQPNLYLDYYLPETSGQRFSTIFSVNAGFSF